MELHRLRRHPCPGRPSIRDHDPLWLILLAGLLVVTFVPWFTLFGPQLLGFGN
jgi:hypothetical protein